MITTKDMTRLISELAAQPNCDGDHEEWCEEHDVDPEVIDAMVFCMGQAMAAAAKINGGDRLQAFGSAILTTFILGWETHKQYG